MHQQQLKCVWKDQINFHLKLLIKFKLKFTLNIPVSCLFTSIVIYIGLVYIQTIRKHTIDRQQLDLHSREVKRSIDTQSKGAKTGSIFFPKGSKWNAAKANHQIINLCATQKSVKFKNTHTWEGKSKERLQKFHSHLTSLLFKRGHIFFGAFLINTLRSSITTPKINIMRHISKKWAFRDKNVVVIMKTF